MKIKGVKIEGPNVKDIVIPRANGNDIYLKAQAVLDMGPFNAMCPQPEPPTVMGKGGVKQADLSDKFYKGAVTQWAANRMNWIILQSLKATEGLEWETVDYEKPETWTNYEVELKNSGFSEFEVGRIANYVLEVNCLSESVIDEARKRFLVSQAAQPST